MPGFFIVYKVLCSIMFIENFNEEDITESKADKIKSDLEKKGLKGNIVSVEYGDRFYMKSELQNVDFIITELDNLGVYFKNTPKMQVIAKEIYDIYGTKENSRELGHSTMYGTFPDQGSDFIYDFPTKTDGSETFQYGAKLNDTDPYVGVSYIRK